jgi:hypothetical protein
MPATNGGNNLGEGFAEKQWVQSFLQEKQMPASP